MSAAAVQTSARVAEPDMFVGLDLATSFDRHLLVCIEGVLLADAVVRTQLVGQDLHPRPVLCIEIRPLSGAHHTTHAEWVYTEASRKQAERVAATLRKGSRVSVTTPLDGMRTTLPHVASVALIPTTAKAPQ